MIDLLSPPPLRRNMEILVCREESYFLADVFGITEKELTMPRNGLVKPCKVVLGRARKSAYSLIRRQNGCSGQRNRIQTSGSLYPVKLIGCVPIRGLKSTACELT